MMQSKKHPAPFAVRCSGDTLEGVALRSKWAPCGIVYLSREGQHGYLWQLYNQDKRWYCPNCGSSAEFQDDIYEEAMEDAEKEMEDALGKNYER